MNPLPGTAELLKKLRKFCIPWRSLIIAIDGRNGAGKSSLGRYLSWQLGVPLIETDFWIIDGSHVEQKISEIQDLIRKRRDLRRPIIVEGIMMLQMLERAGLTSDFLVVVTNQAQKPDPDDDTSDLPQCLSTEVEAYLKKYHPEDKADFHLVWG